MPSQRFHRVTLAACALQLAGAHYSMSQPAWNAGSADTSECDEVINTTYGYQDFASDLAELAKGKSKPNCFTLKEGDKLPSAGKLFFFKYAADDVTAHHIVVTQNMTNTPSPTDGTLCVKTSGNYQKLMQCLWKLERQSFWFNTGTQIGCSEVTGQAAQPCPSANSQQPTNNDPKLLSFNQFNEDVDPAHCDGNGDVNGQACPKYNPWRAPGYSPVLDACGIVGGFTFASPEIYFGGPTVEGGTVPSTTSIINAAAAPAGLEYKAGTKGSSLVYDFLNGGHKYTTNVTKWTAGGTAEVAQGSLYANHGGGYQYRLCKQSEFTADGAANEECFQKMPLSYATGESWIRTSNGTEIAFPAVRVTEANTEGVKPKGSTWTKMPVPNCVGSDYSPFCDGARTSVGSYPLQLAEVFHALNSSLDYSKTPMQFAPPVPANSSVHAFGDGMSVYGLIEGVLTKDTTSAVYAAQKQQYNFEVVDRVKVPQVQPGMYVLSWRWDSEQTPQVWANCAVVQIEEKEAKIKTDAQKKRSLRGAKIN